MTDRLRFWILSIGFAMTAGLVTMLGVVIGAEPTALYLAHSLGSHPTTPIFTPPFVNDLGRWIGFAAFLGCLGIALDIDKPTRRRW